MTAPLADLLQIWGFQDDFIVFSDGSLGFALEVTPVDVSCWDDTHIDRFVTKLGHFLNGLPTGLDLQFLQEIDSGNESLLARYHALKKEPIDSTRQALLEARVANLRREDHEGFLPRHTLKVFARHLPDSPFLKKPRLFSRPRLFEPIAEAELMRAVRSLQAVREDLGRALLSLDMKVAFLPERAVAELVYRQWNPARQAPLGQYDPEEIRSSLVFTDVGIYESGFSLGKLHYRVLSLKGLPDQTFASMARALRSLPYGSRLALSIHVPDQQKEIDNLQIQRRLAFSMARGKRSGVSDIESEAKFQDLEQLLSQMIASGEKVFQVSLNVILRSESEEELGAQVSQALATIRELSGAEAMEETLASFDVFSELAIPNSRTKERAKRVKTSNLSDLLPVFGPWAGHETTRILLKSSMGSLISFDPFSKDLSNYNQIVTGGSGSGKSFMTNVLLLQLLKENPWIFIVDVGGSYKKLCQNLSGQYVAFDLSSNLSINPFDLLEGESEPSGEKVKFLSGLIELMTKEEGQKRLGRLEQAEIEATISDVYKTGSPSLSTLRDCLLKHPDPAISRFGKILGPWCGNTPYGRIVDRPTSVELARSLISFDLKGLEAHPDLQAVSLYLITDFLWREFQRDRFSMKIFVLDECWKTLESDAGAALTGEVFRTLRKYFGSAIAISQNIDDFAKSKIANAILPNTSIKWVLMQKGADQARLKEVLQLNDTEMAIISSLHQERGRYSQAFLMAEDKHSAVSIEPTPLEYWIATTDPRDLAAIDAAEKKEPEKLPLEILRDLARRFPQGIAARSEVT